MNLVFGMVILALLVYLVVQIGFRSFLLNWNATSAEVAAVLPGDELIFRPEVVGTRAITISGSPAQVWPWLVQLGAERGGWYSYTWLERLVACPITNANSINTEWQIINVGDQVSLCPDGESPPPYMVALVEPNRALVLGHRSDASTTNLSLTGWYETWAFVLQPANAAQTRLIVRSRRASDDSLMRSLEPGFFVMERGMLLGIKGRVEGYIR
jgi:hypothetical protein